MTQDKYNSGVNRDFSQNKEKKEKSKSNFHKRAGATLASGGRLDWETPPSLFKELDDEFHFVLDSAATEQNKLCKYYYTSEDDGLAKSWNRENGAVYCNPPYGKKIIQWVAKGATEATTHDITVVMLIPAKPDIKLFHRYIWDKKKGEFRPNVEVRFIEGRLSFYLKGKREKDPAAFPSMIVVFNGKNGKARARPDISLTLRAEAETKRDSIERSTEHLEPVSYVTLDEDGNMIVRQLTDQTEHSDSLGDSN